MPRGLPGPDARSRKARWKTGRYSNAAKKARQEALADVRRTGRFIEMLTWYDELFHYLEDIEIQVKCGRAEGLKTKCVVALRMWLKFQALMRGWETVGGSGRRKKTTQLEEMVSSLLKAGAAGLELEEMGKIIRSAASRSGRRLPIPNLIPSKLARVEERLRGRLAKAVFAGVGPFPIVGCTEALPPSTRALPVLSSGS